MENHYHFMDTSMEIDILFVIGSMMADDHFGDLCHSALDMMGGFSSTFGTVEQPMVVVRVSLLQPWLGTSKMAFKNLRSKWRYFAQAKICSQNDRRMVPQLLSPEPLGSMNGVEICWRYFCGKMVTAHGQSASKAAVQGFRDMAAAQLHFATSSTERWKWARSAEPPPAQKWSDYDTVHTDWQSWCQGENNQKLTQQKSESP